jgi:fatty-acyl-CoA synthase
MNVGRFLDIVEARFSDKLAIVSEGKRYTFRQLKERVQRLMTGLVKLGIKKGDRVATLMWNCSELIEVYLATIRIGGIYTPISYRLKELEIRRILKEVMPSFFVTDEKLQDIAGQVIAEIPELQHNFSLSTRLLNGFESYEILLADSQPFVGMGNVATDDPCQLVYTSGTTSRPKGVILSHENVIWNTINMLQARHDRPEDVALIVGPLFHVAALNSHYTSRLALGATVVIMEKFDPEHLLDLVQREKITVVSGTPTMFIMLMEDCLPGKYDTSSVATLSSGADKLSDHVKKGILEFFPNADGIYDVYGCTECAPCVTTMDAKNSFIKTGSVGPPLPFVEVKLFDNEEREVHVGQSGRIFVRGPNVMKGYYLQPEETAKVFKGDWFYTGDIARADEDGYLYIVDREKDLIITGGENVSPTEVEEVLISHPEILKSAVFGLPDTKWGEKIAAAIVVRKGCQLSPEHIQTYLRERIAGYKIPKIIFFLDKLPESSMGKVQKNVLKENFISKIQGD